VSAANQISLIGTTERLGHARGRLQECSPKGERAGESESNAPSQLGLAEKNQKSIKLACRVFVFALPHSRREYLPCSFVYIRVHPGNLIRLFPLPYPSGQPAVDPSRTCPSARLWFYIILFCGTM
jgi:hypothetical protein